MAQFHENVNLKNLVAIGRTGDGKSAFCKRFAAFLGHTGSVPFADSQSSHSHTHDPAIFEYEGWRIVDTPGLMDTDGLEKDEENLEKIVTTLRNLGEINLFVLVVNYGNHRFDHGMQDAIKLFYDSFGPNFIKNLAVVFTHVSYFI